MMISDTGKLNASIKFTSSFLVKGRFLKFRRYHNFANLFSKFSETTCYKEISKFSIKYRVKSIRLAVSRGIP